MRIFVIQILEYLEQYKSDTNCKQEEQKSRNKNYSVNNYTNISDVESLQHTNNNIRNELKNKVLFDITNPEDYYLSIIIYISGMTDKFAIDAYNEIISF